MSMELFFGWPTSSKNPPISVFTVTGACCRAGGAGTLNLGLQAHTVGILLTQLAISQLLIHIHLNSIYIYVTISISKPLS